MFQRDRRAADCERVFVPQRHTVHFLDRDSWQPAYLGRSDTRARAGCADRLHAARQFYFWNRADRRQDVAFYSALRGRNRCRRSEEIDRAHSLARVIKWFLERPKWGRPS
jgi:hypothetical protein